MAGWLLVGLQAMLLAALILAPHRATSMLPVTVGMLVLAVGAWLLIVAARALGPALTPTPVPNERGIATTGVYAHIRHPIYTSLLLIATGWTIAVGSWWTLLATLALLVLFVVKATWEDVLLERAYGDAWRAWAARTGAFLPRSRP